MQTTKEIAEFFERSFTCIPQCIYIGNVKDDHNGHQNPSKIVNFTTKLKKNSYYNLY